MKSKSHLLLLFKKKLCVRQPFAKFTIDHGLALPLPGFHVDGVGGKVWPTFVNR